MKNIIEYAFEQYSGNKAYGVFVMKLPENIQRMNMCFKEIKDLFASAGIDDFSRLPSDPTERQKFSKLFRELNKYLEPAKVQGFVWDKLTYEVEDSDGVSGVYTVDFDKGIYDALLMRYKELSRGGDGGGEDAAYDIDPYLMSLSTEKIDADYMDSRFKKYIKTLDEHADEATVDAALNELHRSFASLSQDEQKFANIVLKDIQNGDLIVHDDRSVRDYIVEYQARAKNDQIHRMAEILGLHEQKLRDIMDKHVTENDIDAFGQYNDLVQSVDIDTAKAYFDKKEGEDIPKRKVRSKLDSLLRKYILSGGFDIE